MTAKHRTMRTPHSRVEGLGSARAGTMHFWRQRMTAVMLAPLAIWFVASALAYVGAEQGAVAAFFANPINAVLMLLFVLASTYHMALGLQIIIEDYVHQEGAKIACLILNQVVAWGVGATSTLAIVRMLLSGY
jgi:succinate dehydrogenase / fumarate reductase membrane anchor subunit